MKSLLPTWPLERLLPCLGSTGSAFGGLAVMCCVGWTGLATLLPTLGLGFLVYIENALRLIYAALALHALGLGFSFRRHRRPWPLAAAALGAGLLLYPMYHALEVVLWVGMVYTGLGLLFLSSGLDVLCAWRMNRTCSPAIGRKPREQKARISLEDMEGVEPS
jgi:hypothetical protein